MRIFVTGATGFIGSALCTRLREAEHQVVAWVRAPEKARRILGEGVELAEAKDLEGSLLAAVDGCDAIVNLAGESIFNGRWTEAKKKLLVESRLGVTNGVVNALAKATRPPKVFVSASAVGYYGIRRDEAIDEAATPGEDFLADLCQRWEAAAERAASHNARVAILRFGIVLGKGGGALSRLLPVFKMGVGGKLGAGDQPFPFIHIDDLVDMLLTALTDDRWHGTFNATAPKTITNAELTHELGQALHRPTIFPVPAPAMKLILGEAAGPILGGQRAIPSHAQELGFEFRHPTIHSTLEAVVAR